MTASVADRMLARLPTYLTYVRERPSWLLTLIFGRFVILRRLERLIHHAPPQPADELSSTLVAMPDRASLMETLLVDGIATGPQLSEPAVAAIRDFAERTPCAVRSGAPGEFLPRDIAAFNQSRDQDALTGYYFSRVNDCPVIAEIERDPAIVDVARAFIGADPTHIRTRLWWSFPAERVSDAAFHAVAQNKFHFDLNDFRTVKFFFYLTDVTAGSGPHACVRGSHRHRRLRHQFTMLVGHSEESLRRYYRKEDFMIITGSAGTGFVEDPFIFHLGLACRDTPRLLLEIEYGRGAMSPSYRYGELG